MIEICQFGAGRIGLIGVNPRFKNLIPFEHMDYLKERFPEAKVAIGRGITAVQRTFKEIFNLPEEFPTDGRQFDALFDDGDIF